MLSFVGAFAQSGDEAITWRHSREAVLLQNFVRAMTCAAGILFCRPRPPRRGASW